MIPSTCYLDLDGVLVNFSKGYKKLSNGMSIRRYLETHTKPEAKNLFLNAGTKFWEELEWIEGGKELYDTASRLYKCIKILSSTGTQDETKSKIVEEGKRNWIKQHIPTIQPKDIFIVRGRLHKKEHASPNAILVDDVMETIHDWNAAGGVGIHHDYKNYQLTIDKLERLA